MEPVLQRREAFHVMGVQARIDPPKADYNDLWRNRFDPRFPEIRKYAADDTCFGVYFPCGEPEMADFVAGQKVGDVDVVPDGLVMREVPACDEAVVECTLSTIGPTWGRLFGEWLPGSGYAAAPDLPAFEVFPAGECGPESKVFIHMPVHKHQ
jgi:predicted transcriptional regulator YdeE